MDFEKWLTIAVRLLLSIAFCTLNLVVRSQISDDLPVWMHGILEWVPEDEADAIDVDSFLEYLAEIHDNPIDINQVNEIQLGTFLFLSPTQIRSIIQYREEVGQFVSVYELQGLEDLSPDQIRILIRLVKVYDSKYLTDLKNNKESVQQQLILQFGRQIEKSTGFLQKGSDKSHYSGDPWRALIKYKLSNPSYWRLHLTLEKDTGEPWWHGTRSKGIDFVSLGFHVPKVKKWENIIVGDYGLQFGEGLGLWMGYGTSKGSIFHGVAKPGGMTRPHTGSGEFGYLRGITGTFNRAGWRVTPYLSFRKLDASLEQNESGELYAKTISSSGLHRTNTETENRRSFQHFISGLSAEREIPWGQVGVNAYANFSRLRLDPDAIPRNLYRFRGDKYWNSSVYWKFHLKNLYIFGEYGVVNLNATAGLAGFLYSLGPELSWSFLYRNYQAGYHSYLPQAFGEQSVPSNERGYYNGVLFQPSKYFSVFTYFDVFEFPWLKYRVDAPSSGWDLMTEWRYSIRKSWQIKVRYRTGYKEENFDDGMQENRIIGVKNQLVRLDVNWQPSNSWEMRLKAHVQERHRDARDSSLNGLLAIDAFFRSKSFLQLNLRLSGLKSWRGSAVPIYFFENSVLNGHGSKPYQNPGYRYYCNIRLRFNRNHSVWINASQSWFPSLTSIGSGLDEVPDNMKTDFKLVWRWIK